MQRYKLMNEKDKAVYVTRNISLEKSNYEKLSIPKIKYLSFQDHIFQEACA